MSHGVDPGPARIVLVGFMAAGKSTVGRVLADRLDWSFIDFDDVIQQRCGRSPGAVIREDGEAAFRQLEAEATTALAGRERVVLAPGGGWALRPALTAALGPGTVRVWLRVTPEEAVRRAEADGTDRPLLGPPEGRLERVRRLLAERSPHYAAAELVVDVDDRRPDEVAGEILERIGLRTGG
ncbi:MAG: shikimate kinase [Gemmatimonadota bacterium]